MGDYGESIDITSPFFRRTSDDATILTQALQMRLETRRGAYWDDPDYGLLVDDYLNAGLTSDALVGIAAALKAEVEKDERVRSAAVTCVPEQTAGGWSVKPDIRVFPVRGETFQFTGPILSFTGETLRKGA